MYVEGLASEAAGAVDAGGSDGLAVDFIHDVALASQVFKEHAQEAVDDEG